MASSYNNFARQYNCSRADSTEFASGHEIRHSVSGFCAGKLRHNRLESSGTDARDCRLRLVWNSSVDWRTGDSHLFRFDNSELANAAWRRNRRTHADRMDFVSNFLGDEYFYYLSRNGFAASRRKLGCAVCFNYDSGFACVDFVSSGRRRIFIKRTRKISNGGRILENFYSVFDGDDRFLGDTFAEYAGLYALREKPARANRRANRRPADDDGYFRSDGNFNYFGGSRRFSERETGRTLGPCKTRRTIQPATDRGDFDVYDYRRYIVSQYCGKRRLAG